MAERVRATVLVYHPDEASAYAALIRAPRRRVTVRVARDAAEAVPHAGEADVLYGWNIPPGLWAVLPRLRWVQAMGAGVDWALGALPPGVALTRTPGIFGPWMAEYVLGWCLWVTQRMEAFRQAQRERRWRHELVPGRLAGMTLAVVGLGDIGRAIARAARAFGVRVVGVSRSGRPVAGVERVHRPAALGRALAAADVVVLTLPLTAETRGLLGARALAAMRPTAWLVNVGRGAVVDEAALVDALAGQRAAHRGRDPRCLRHRAPAAGASALGPRQRRRHAPRLGAQHPGGDRADLQRQPGALARRPAAAPRRGPRAGILSAAREARRELFEPSRPARTRCAPADVAPGGHRPPGTVPRDARDATSSRSASGRAPGAAAPSARTCRRRPRARPPAARRAG